MALVVAAADAELTAMTQEVTACLADGSVDRAVGVFLTQASVWFAQGQLSNIKAGLSLFSPQMMQGVSWLAFWHAVCLELEPEAWRAQVAVCHHRFEGDGELIGAVLSACLIVQSFLLEMNDIRGIVTWLDFIENALSLPGLPPDLVLQANACLLIGNLHHRPGHVGLPGYATTIEEALNWPLPEEPRLLFSAYLLNYYTWAGRFDDGLLVLNHVRERVNVPACSPMAGALWATVSMAWTSFSGRKDMIDAQTQAARALLEIHEFAPVHATVFLHLVHVYLNLGLIEQGRSILLEFSPKVTITRRFDRVFFHEFASWFALLDGDVTLAIENARKSVALIQRTGDELIDGYVTFGLASCLLHSRELAEAEQLLATLGEAVIWENSPLLKFSLALQMALLFSRQGRLHEALLKLSLALDCGRRFALYTTCRWEPVPMAELLDLALEHDIETPYVHKLIELRDLPAPSLVSEFWPKKIKIYTLGRFAISVNGDRVSLGEKGSSKAIKLLQHLILRGGRSVALQSVADALWPDAEGDLARANFDVTLGRLRKLLGDKRAILLSNEMLSINADMCWLDVWALHSLFNRLERQESADVCRLTKIKDHLMRMYQGSFLQGQELGLAQENAALRYQRLLQNSINRLVELLPEIADRDQLVRWSAHVLSLSGE